MRLRVCYRAEKETLWEFMSEVEDQVKKRRWTLVEMVRFPGMLTNVLQLFLNLPERVVYGNRYEFRWYAIIEGKAKKSEMNDGSLHAMAPAPSWDISPSSK